MKSLLTKATFTACLGLKLTCGITAIHLACQPTLTDQQSNILERSLILYSLTDTIMPNVLTKRSDKK